MGERCEGKEGGWEKVVKGRKGGREEGCSVFAATDDFLLEMTPLKGVKAGLRVEYVGA